MNFSFWPRFYQQIMRDAVGFAEIGNRVINLIRSAQAFRQVEHVRELSNVLISLPITEFKLIGRYYLIWCKCREQIYDSEQLEEIIEQSSTYKAKGLLSRAAFEGYKGNTASELYFCNEALKASPTTSEYIDICKAISVVKAKEGFHESAIKELENLIPLLRYADPLVRFDVLNSYAVELIETDRLNESEQVCRKVLSSPYSSAFPEWQETKDAVDHKLLRRRTHAPKKPKNSPELESRKVTEIGRHLQLVRPISAPQNEQAQVIDMFTAKSALALKEDDTFEGRLKLMDIATNPKSTKEEIEFMLAARALIYV
jgi:hypothetical protein